MHCGNKVETFKSISHSTQPFLYDIFMNLFLSICDKPACVQIFFIHSLRIWYTYTMYLDDSNFFAPHLTPRLLYHTPLPTWCCLFVTHWVQSVLSLFPRVWGQILDLRKSTRGHFLKKQVVFFNQCKILALILLCSLLFPISSSYCFISKKKCLS